MTYYYFHSNFKYSIKVSSNQRYKKEVILAKATAVAEELLSSIRTVKAFEGEDNGVKR